MRLENDLFTVVGGDADHVRVRLNGRHPIYQGHFPGRPVTPGVCQLQLVGELAGDRVGRRLMLREIVNLKFVAPVMPDATPLIDVSLSSVTTAGEAVHVKGSIAAEDGVKTKFSVVYQ